MGTGIDIVFINRFENANKTFLENCFTENELLYAKNRKESLAGMFAAKEAVLKSIGIGIIGVSIKDIEINHHSSGQPYIRLYNDFKDKYTHTDFSISISHDGEYAIAIAIYKKMN